MSNPATTTTTTTTTSPIIKPMIGAVAAFAIDTFAFGSQDQQSSMLLGAGVGAAFFAAPYVSNMLPFESTLSSIGTDGGVSAEARVVECGLGLGMTYLIEEYVLNNGFHQEDLSRKMACIVGADFISTYLSEYLSAQPLAFVSGTGI